MSSIQYVNHFTATLAAGIGESDTILSLTLTNSTAFTVNDNSLVPLTILNPSSLSVYEVVYCSAVSGGSYTVIRGKEGSAQSWPAGALVKCGTTASLLNQTSIAGSPSVWSSDVSTLVGGYAFGAQVIDSSGNIWRSTVANNITQPGVSGASWQSLFDGYVTEAWLEAQKYVGQQIDSNTIGVDRAGYSATAKSLAFRSTDGTWHYPVTSEPVNGQDRVLQLGFDTSTNLLQALGLSGVTRSFLPGSQASITNGTSTTLGGQKWQSFYIESISGSSTQVTFPLGFSALPTVLLQPTSEFNTNLAIQANPVPGTLTTGGFKVNINNAPGVASTNGCGLWVWAFGAL